MSDARNDKSSRRTPEDLRRLLADGARERAILRERCRQCDEPRVLGHDVGGACRQVEPVDPPPKLYDGPVYPVHVRRAEILQDFSDAARLFNGRTGARGASISPGRLVRQVPPEFLAPAQHEAERQRRARVFTALRVWEAEANEDREAVARIARSIRLSLPATRERKLADGVSLPVHHDGDSTPGRGEVFALVSMNVPVGSDEDGDDLYLDDVLVDANPYAAELLAEHERELDLALSCMNSAWRALPRCDQQTRIRTWCRAELLAAGIDADRYTWILSDRWRAVAASRRLGNAEAFRRVVHEERPRTRPVSIRTLVVALLDYGRHPLSPRELGLLALVLGDWPDRLADGATPFQVLRAVLDGIEQTAKEYGAHRSRPMAPETTSESRETSAPKIILPGSSEVMRSCFRSGTPPLGMRPDRGGRDGGVFLGPEKVSCRTATI